MRPFDPPQLEQEQRANVGIGSKNGDANGEALL
jgi:hypothetical protein